MNMPDHITDGEDQFDNSKAKEVDEDKAIAVIQEALLQGDKFKIYGKYTVDFSNVIDDNLTCNTEFANALRSLMNGDPKAVFKVRDIANKATLKLATDIYKDMEIRG